MALPPRNRVWFALYSVASTCYRWMVLIFILWFLSRVFEPYGLQPLGHILIAMSLFGIVVMPLWKSFKFFRVPGRTRQVKKIPLFITLALVASLISAVALVPVPHRVITTLVVQPSDAEPVYVTVPGYRPEHLDIQPGDYVEEKQPLAVLKNEDVGNEVKQFEHRESELDQKLIDLDKQRNSNPQAEAFIPQTRKTLETVKEQKEKRVDEQRRLKLVAPVAGFVIAPPDIPDPPNDDENLPSWSGTPLDEINQNCWLETGTLFCMVGNPDHMEALLIIDQSDLEFVRHGQRVDIKLDEYPNKVLTGHIEEISQIDLKYAPRELTSEAGGELTTKRDETGKEKPMSASYQARVPIENFDGKLLQGFRGRAKIHTGSRTLGQMFVRYLFKTFRFG